MENGATHVEPPRPEPLKGVGGPIGPPVPQAPRIVRRGAGPRNLDHPRFALDPRRESV